MVDDSANWRRPLLSPSERHAKSVLDEVVKHRRSLIMPGFKFSRVITQRPAGITYAEWEYATKAHLDFVVCDSDTTLPEFAVEVVIRHTCCPMLNGVIGEG